MQLTKSLTQNENSAIFFHLAPCQTGGFSTLNLILEFLWQLCIIKSCINMHIPPFGLKIHSSINWNCELQSAFLL